MTTAIDVLERRALWSVEQGEVPGCLKGLPDRCVDATVFSPPYERARTYEEDGTDYAIARNTEQWVAWMLTVMKECLRVTRGVVVCVCEGQTRDFRYSGGPVLLWADMIRAGICTRKAPIYRRVGIPGSGGPDWWRNDYEFCLVATHGGKLPWSDNTATGHPPKWAPGGEMSYRTVDGRRINAETQAMTRRGRRTKAQKLELGAKLHTKRDPGPQANGDTMREQAYLPPVLANPGNVIDCVVGGRRMGSDLASDNEASFPEDLVMPFIRCFCPPEGIVLDAFAGSGTTLAVALKWGRRAIGFDLRASQVALTTRRIKEEATTMFDAIETEETPPCP